MICVSSKNLSKSKRKISSFRLKPKIEIVSDSLVRSSLTEPTKKKLTNSNSVAGFPRKDLKTKIFSRISDNFMKLDF